MLRSCLQCFNKISTSQVMGLVRAKQANDPLAAARMLIDVRSTAEVAQTGLIPTAVNIPLSILADVLNYDDANLSEDDFEEAFGAKRPIKGETTLIFYCAHGIRSARAADIANELGFTGALNYSGSWEEWCSVLDSKSR